MKLPSPSPAASLFLVFASSCCLSKIHAQTSRGNRPFGGGNFGNQPGSPGLQPDFVTKTCDAQWECPLLLHGGEETTGIFVCRQTYHPIFGTKQSKAKCISSQEAYETDECGCCREDDCPSIPSVQTITCDDATPPDDGLIPENEIPTPISGPTIDNEQDRRGLGKNRGGGNRGNRLPENAVIVCRQLYNPYTGILEGMSMYIDPKRSMDGDNCGCCEGICPENLDTRGPRFTRPDHVELSWCDNANDADGATGNGYISCTLPQRNGGEGVFVCRSMANMLTGVSESQALCIPPDRAWETDQCGCCGQDCPEQPLPVDLECNVGTTDENGNAIPAESITQECQFRNGDMGFFVCRSLFHPLDGSVTQRTLCLKDDDEDGKNSWTTDQCGCCGSSSCPETPEGGFPRVDTQMMQLSLEGGDGVTADFGGELRAQEALSDDSNSSVGLGLVFLAFLILAVLLVQRYAHSCANSSRK